VIAHDRLDQQAGAPVRASRQPPGFGMSASDKKSYPLRISPQVLDAVQRWANDDLRSLNAQIEYLLRDALRKAGRFKADAPPHKSAK
jgi:hypothetical protein